MAVFPCDWSAHRYPGAQRSVYVTFVSGGLVDTNKLRLCDKHLQLELDVIKKAMMPVDEDSQQSATCERCPSDRAGTVFAKVFDANQEPEVYAVDLCGPCTATLAGQLKVANGRPLAAR